MYTRIIGNANCSRCEQTKSILASNNVSYKYELLEELSPEENSKFISQARRKGVFSAPIIVVDDEVKTLQEVLDLCK